MESYRIYKSLPMQDFMSMTAYVFAKAGVDLLGLIQDTNYLRKIKDEPEETMKKRFASEAEAVLEKYPDRLTRTCNMAEFSHFYLFIMEPEAQEHNWWKEISDPLRNYPGENIWSDGEQILCKTKEAAECLAEMFVTLYSQQKQNVTAVMGFYNPEEDVKDDTVDDYTGYWYIFLE